MYLSLTTCNKKLFPAFLDFTPFEPIIKKMTEKVQQAGRSIIGIISIGCLIGFCQSALCASVAKAHAQSKLRLQSSVAAQPLVKFEIQDESAGTLAVAALIVILISVFMLQLQFGRVYSVAKSPYQSRAPPSWR